MKTLTGKIILVTGASRGIGAAIAQKLAAEGATVVVNYAGNKEAADKTVAAIKELGVEAMAIQADVSKSDEVKKMFDTVIAQYGRMDVLINNAGILLYKLIKDTSDEDFDRQFAINVKGTFNTMREAATRLADNGTIINFSSTTTRLLLPTYGPYVATKGAVEQMTRVFAKEVGARGINVNVVSPGPTNTELFLNGKTQEALDRLAGLSAFNRIGEPEDIAKVVAFLVSDDAKWISGQNIGANGGMA
ncbi:SDR family oxidoreductase [Chitinophaga sancti]|uniref:3-oxoacyl-[acyl-carrier protein] reductase n=1 Tax=Chitinophaga sancti TaxID=1004 RepID=A0A1K1QDS9_9BACT|nr:SDR family oxidoreductase [Chitinophaga sancti]WQD61400.1 SDR family oxidoreductase [Chitinophaga sancti]WQG93047.1 SDR family oxidoreductase [Chitinophaga sancti]SFW57860.1 3-oxoacyl-[acyl-carrier protein] reductase [Chitinophaga sancti]